MDLTYSPPAFAAPRSTGSRYLAALGVCLLGYAVLGRTFAYVGVPPIFLSEVMLLIGLVVALGSRKVGAVLAAWPVRLWVVLMAWVAIRTLPYLGRDGLDAPRDAMLVGYGFYAVIVASLLLADPERLRDLVGRYRKGAAVILGLVWLVYLVNKMVGEGLPTIPWNADVKIPEAKGGDLMVHMTAVTAFLMLGLMCSRPVWVLLAAFSSGIIMISNRGGMVAFVLGLGLAWLMRPRGAGVGKIVYAFIALVMIGAVVGPMLQLQVQGGTRDLTVDQVVDNVKSIFGRSNSNALDGTKRWRLLWWTDIVNYTVNGSYFWTGKGFGVNLAEADGYSVGDDDSLRSPHNGHLTVLARAGVPGALLWLLLHAAWFGSVMLAWLRARRADQRRWQAVFSPGWRASGSRATSTPHSTCSWKARWAASGYGP